MPASSGRYGRSMGVATSATESGHVDGAEGGGDAAALGDVLVASAAVSGVGAVALVGPQEAVDLGEVDPRQQVRVGRRVGAAVRGGADDAAVHGAHDVDLPLGVRRPTRTS